MDVVSPYEALEGCWGLLFGSRDHWKTKTKKTLIASIISWLSFGCFTNFTNVRPFEWFHCLCIFPLSFTSYLCVDLECYESLGAPLMMYIWIFCTLPACVQILFSLSTYQGTGNCSTVRIYLLLLTWIAQWRIASIIKHSSAPLSLSCNLNLDLAGGGVVCVLLI